MGSGDLTPGQKRQRLLERRALKIANARSVTFALAITFLSIAFGAAILIRLVDQHDFSSFGLAVWWALETITTVGYGDIVPTTTVGRVVGGTEMLLGIAFITFLTAGVTSTVINRSQQGAQEADRAHLEGEIQRILDALTETKAQNTALGERLGVIESKLSG